MKKSAIFIFAAIFLQCTGSSAPETYIPSDGRMTDGTVLDVTSEGDVRIGARGSLIVRANDGAVFIAGPFQAGNLKVDQNGNVFVNGQKLKVSMLKKSENLNEDKLISLERKIEILEEKIDMLEKENQRLQREYTASKL